MCTVVSFKGSPWQPILAAARSRRLAIMISERERVREREMTVDHWLHHYNSYNMIASPLPLTN